MLIPLSFIKVYEGGHHAVLCDKTVHLQISGDGIGSCAIHSAPSAANAPVEINAIFSCDCAKYKKETAEEWIKRRKIVHLTGTRLSPEVVLARTAEKVSRVKAVFVVIQWDDDTFDMDWSQTPASVLCMAARIFDRQVDRTLNGDDQEQG